MTDRCKFYRPESWLDRSPQSRQESRHHAFSKPTLRPGVLDKSTVIQYNSRHILWSRWRKEEVLKVAGTGPGTTYCRPGLAGGCILQVKPTSRELSIAAVATHATPDWPA